MNIIEAIKSGKKFTRPSWHRFYENNFGLTHKFNQDDLLADDWEIEEEKIVITRTQFFKASEQARRAYGSPSGQHLEHFTLLFAEHLGFKS